MQWRHLPSAVVAVCSAVGGVKDSSVLWVMVELVGMDELAEMVELG